MTPPEGVPDLGSALRRGARRQLADLKERGIEGLLFTAAFVAVVVTGAIFWVLIDNAATFFSFPEVGIVEFLTGTEWSADIRQKYGVLPLVTGTMMVTVGASVIAIPLGIGTAIFLSEFAPDWVRSVMKPVIEVLASIPSIVFGLFAVLVISPILQDWFDAAVFNAANAIIVLAFMVLPIITTLSEDALNAVPDDLRQGALALGATRWEVATSVTTPAALSGIIAAVLLGFGRAIGETMAVTLAAGARPTMALDLFQSIQTMTAFIAQRSQGDIVQTGPAFYSLFAVGLLLFLMTFAINLAAQWVIARYREVY